MSFANSWANDVCGLPTTSAVGWPPKPKDSDGSFGRGGYDRGAGDVVALAPRLIAQKYDGSGKRGPGRPRTAAEIVELVVRMAEQNRDWGYRRIQGALSNLGHKLARSTIADILERHGIEPAPDRCRKPRGRNF